MTIDTLRNGLSITRREGRAYLEYKSTTIPIGDLDEFRQDLDELPEEETEYDRYENAMIENAEINREI
jgi:hypothetical protein